MDLSTTYMGLKLKNPLVAAASPLSYELSCIKRLEDSGAAAVVLYSLFEEQICNEEWEHDHHTTQGSESFAEALTYFPRSGFFHTEPDKYLELIRRAKKSVDVPIIASLNGASHGGWVEYARRMEQAGADGLELNIYLIPTDPEVNGSELEREYMRILAATKSCVTIPVAVKLSPYFSSLPNFARKLDRVGADALVLFNRFYQPDFDLEQLEVVPKVFPSRPGSMLLSLRWIAILRGQIKASLAANGGIHSAEDIIKVVMAGADAAQLCAVLLQNGIEYLEHLIHDVTEWMELHEYRSIEQLKGSMSQQSVADPAAFERANYMKVLNSPLNLTRPGGGQWTSRPH